MGLLLGGELVGRRLAGALGDGQCRPRLVQVLRPLLEEIALRGLESCSFDSRLAGLFVAMDACASAISAFRWATYARSRVW